MKRLFAILLFVVLGCACVYSQGTRAGGSGSVGGLTTAQASGTVTLTSISVTAPTPSQNVGQNLGFRATGNFSSGPSVDLTKYATWSSSNQVIANPLVQLPSDSVQNVACLSPGTVQISASYGGITGSTPLTCNAVLPPTPTPSSLAISPTSPTIPQGRIGGVQYRAIETYSDGSTQDVTASAVWSSSNSAIVAKGPLSTTQEFDCVGTGSATVSATNDSLPSASTTQTCSAVLSTISVTPASPSILAGSTLQFIATCTFTDGSSGSCSAPTWSSSTTATATISSSGVATAVAAGTTTIKAQLGSISGTTVLTVTAPGPPTPTLSSITVTPAAKTVNVGSSIVLTATGNYSDGSTQNLSAASAWTTSNSAVAALQCPDGVIGQAYNCTLTGTGATPYQWTVPALASSGQVDILDYAAMPLPTRNTTHLAVTGLYKAFHIDAGLLWWIKNAQGSPWDGEAYDGKFFYHWFTENGDSTQQAACQAAGYSSCFLDPFAYKLFVTPVPIAPRYFTLGGPDVVIKSPSPNNFIRTTNCGTDNQPLINLGNIMGITHDAGNVNWGGSVGTVRTLEIQYYWGIANETTVPPTSGTRERYELAQGFGQVQWDTSSWNGTGWTVNQTSLNNTTVAGGAPTPNFGCKLPNSPLTGGLPPGTIATSSPELNLHDTTGVIDGTPTQAGTYNFTAQQEDAGAAFHMQPQTIIVNALATTATQTVKCLTAGTVTITATDGIAGNTTVTCQTPTPTLSSIAVAPASPTQFNGSSTTFTATGTYSDGSTQNLTTTATWTTGTASVATISANVATCVANSGTSVITATVGAVSGTQTLTCKAVTIGTAGNSYCTTSGTWIGPTTDAGAALPTACMNTALSNTPSPGVVHGPYTTLSALQAAINAGACGDIYQVTAGTNLGTGTLNLPGKGCDNAHWNLLETTGVTDPNFPAEGTRATPCIFNVQTMPGRSYPCPTPRNLGFSLSAGNASNAIRIQGGDHWRIIGMEATRVSTGGVAIYILADLSNSGGTQTNNIILDRSWFAGIEPTLPSASQSTDTSTTRAINLGQSNHIAVIDSYFTNFYDTASRSANGNTDAQCIGGGFGGIANSGWGVYKFVNNHCEASGEGILLGGSGGPALTPNGCTITVNCNLDVPTDIEVRQNYFFKPPQWNGNTTVPGGTGWPVVKNGFEMKIGARALFEGNVIENVWYNAQVGYCWSIAPKNQSGGSPLVGTAPTALTNDFTYRYNYCYNAAYGVGLYQSMDSGCTGCQAQGANRISIHDNVIGDNLNLGSLSGTSAGDESEFFAAADSTGKGLNQLNNVTFSHNTSVKGVRALTIFGGGFGQFHSWTIQNNIWAYANFGFMSFASGTGDCSGGANFNKAYLILNSCVSPYTFDHNAVFNWPSGAGALGVNYPTNGSGLGNFFYSSSSGPLFVSYGTGDSSFNPGNYQLQGSSPLHNAGSDGKDIGADIVTLQQKISGLRF